MANFETPPEAKLPSPDASYGVRLTATILRTIFIAALIVLTLRVSIPQSETIWTVYDTPVDAVRLVLGVAVCVWLVIHLFSGPKDADGYRTWLYLGLIAVPFVLICLVAVW